MSDTPNSGEPGPALTRYHFEDAPAGINWLRQEAAGVIHGYEAEYEYQASIETLGDLELALLATTAPALAHRLAPEAPRPPRSPVYHAQPERVFLGMAVTILETPREDRSPDTDNVFQFLASNFEEWGDLHQLRRRVLYPVLRFMDDPEARIDAEARAKGISYARLIPHLTKPIYEKLQPGYQPVGPRTQLLWSQYEVLMEAVKRSRQPRISGQPVDFISDRLAVRYSDSKSG